MKLFYLINLFINFLLCAKSLLLNIWKEQILKNLINFYKHNNFYYYYLKNIIFFFFSLLNKIKSHLFTLLIMRSKNLQKIITILNLKFFIICTLSKRSPLHSLRITYFLISLRIPSLFLLKNNKKLIK